MVTKIDSLNCGNVLVKEPAEKKVSKNDVALFESKQPNIEDTFTTTKPVEKKVEKKTSNKKKWLIALGIVAAVAIGIAAVYFFKNKTPKIAGDTIDKFQHFDDFDVFKDLKMCKNMSLDEKKKAFDVLTTNGNKDLFLSTLHGDKPMSIIGQYKTPLQPGGNDLDVLKKLDLGKNFEFVEANSFSFNGHRSWNQYFVNKSKTLETIARNKEIYTTGLGLPSGTNSKAIYGDLFKNKGALPDDLLGVTLGFPKYDSMIFHLESIGDLRRERLSADYSKKLLDVLRSDKSPYKNLSKTQMAGLENAIKNINPRNLKDIAVKGSYNDGLYQFINYYDDAAELGRIANSTKNYKQVFGITS